MQQHMSIFIKLGQYVNVIKSHNRLFHCHKVSLLPVTSGNLTKPKIGTDTSFHKEVRNSWNQQIWVNIINRIPSSTKKILQKYFRGKWLVMAESTLILPESLRGMKKLNREMFRITVQVPVLKIPVGKIKNVVKNVKISTLRKPGIKPIADIDMDDLDHKTHKLILLHPEKYANYESLTEEDKAELSNIGLDLKSLKYMGIVLTYGNWNYNEILKAVLPADSDGVAGFSQVGHIIHLNLKEELFEYKEIIGLNIFFE